MNATAKNARIVTLHNGVTMPTLAFGCAFGDWIGTNEFQGFQPEQAWRAVSLALDNGYRAFDGARAYGTERIVGTLLGQRLSSGERCAPISSRNTTSRRRPDHGALQHPAAAEI